jgi:plastocyanin
MLATLTRFATLSAVGALLLLAPTFAHQVRADDEPVQITIKTTDAGFEPNTVEVEQGSLVELKFVWEHSAYPEEQHIIVLKDYKVESNQIDFENRETTITFIATETGTFTFKCDLECDLHDYLQNGELIVVPSGSGGGAASFTPTQLTIGPAGVSVRGDTVSVIASLMDDEGNPVPKAELKFYLEETFVATTSLVEIAVAETDDTGFARITYKPTHEGVGQLTAVFSGAGVYDAAETLVEVPSRAVFARAPVQEKEGLEGLRSWAPGGFLLLMLGIWAMFAFSLFKAWSVSRIRAEGGER